MKSYNIYEREVLQMTYVYTFSSCRQFNSNIINNDFPKTCQQLVSLALQKWAEKQRQTDENIVLAVHHKMHEHVYVYLPQ